MARNTEIVRNYLKAFFSGKVDHETVRALLSDDFVFNGPMMKAENADQFIEQLKGHEGGMEMRCEIREILGSGNVVTALYDFQGPTGPMAFAEWYWLADGKITRVELVYDPRAFVELQQAAAK
jgi:hypothetical protein